MSSVRRPLAPRAVAAAALVLALSRAGAAQQVGHLGPSYQGGYLSDFSQPSGIKPESKLWWTDGSWWGCLWSPAARAFTIHRLDTTTQTWTNTGTAIDLRRRSHADCLWSGSKLYVASHEYTSGIGAPDDAIELYRYSYDPNADVYSLDVGYPTQIGNASAEAVTIARDSAGVLWAAWASGRRIWYTHTLGEDHVWQQPAQLPGVTADLSGDDLCSIVSFQNGARIGLLWSDQVADAFRFTFHDTGSGNSVWSPVETALAGLDVADDHLSVKASADGRVFAAVKTSSNEVRLLVRGAGGAWSNALVAASGDRWTRPILVLDEDTRVAHVFATRPVVVGTIYEKTSPLDAIAFAPGIGTPVLRDAAGPAYNDATSTKQSVSRASGLVVLAGNERRRQYGHHHDPIGAPAPAAPIADLAVSSTAGFPSQPLQFFDNSLNQPTTWLWGFGDGTSSTSRNPKKVYSNSGTYTVRLTVTNALGSNTSVRTNLVTIAPPPTQLVLQPVADGHVREATPSRNYGSIASMRVRTQTGDSYRSYLEFFVPPTGMRVVSAAMRLHCVEGGPDGGTLHRAASRWGETELDWWNAPALDSPLRVVGAVASNAPVDLDMTGVVAGAGSASFGIQSASSNSVFYATRESAHAPLLAIQLQYVPGPPTARFESGPRVGGERLTVQFFDASDGLVGQWLWTFGDGGTSTLQNPSHTYAAPGIYPVSLQVSNAQGSNTRVEPGWVVVVDAPGADGGSFDDGAPALPPIAFPMTAAPVRGGGLDGPLAGVVSALSATGTPLSVRRAGGRVELVLALPGSVDSSVDRARAALERALGDAAGSAEIVVRQLAGGAVLALLRLDDA